MGGTNSGTNGEGGPSAAEEAAELLLDGAETPVDRLIERDPAAATALMEWVKRQCMAAYAMGWGAHREIVRTPAPALADRAALYGRDLVPEDAASYSGKATRDLAIASFVLGWNANQETHNAGGRMPPPRKRRGR